MNTQYPATTRLWPAKYLPMVCFNICMFHFNTILYLKHFLYCPIIGIIKAVQNKLKQKLL